MMSGIIKSHYGIAVPLGEWFQLEWPEPCRELHITIKELLQIILSRCTVLERTFFSRRWERPHPNTIRAVEGPIAPFGSPKLDKVAAGLMAKSIEESTM